VQHSTTHGGEGVGPHASKEGRPKPKAPATAAPSQSRPPSFGVLLKFTLSAAPVFISPTLLSLIDTAVVGQASSLELAAMGPACAFCDALVGLMVFISVGTTNLMSTALALDSTQATRREATEQAGGQAESRGSAMTETTKGSLRQEPTPGRVVSVSQLCAVSLGILLTLGVAVFLPVFLPGSAASLAGPDAIIYGAAETYIRIRSFSFPLSLSLMAAQAALLGSKDSRSPSLAVLSAALVNVLLDWVFVIRLGYGIAGAAWATVACQAVAVLMLLRSLFSKKLVQASHFAQLPTRHDITRFFSFGPFMFVLLMKQLTYTQLADLSECLLS